MKDALNKKLKESKEKAEQELREAKEKVHEEIKLRFEQEKAIWRAENNTAAAADKAIPATPTKPSEAPLPQTSAAGAPGFDMSKLGDAETRDLLANNPTVKSIVAANIKKKVDTETKKAREEMDQCLKSEYETKIVTARESGQMMAEKKAALRINMAENKLKTAMAKLDVVASAAADAPERPVGEVWNVAKDARAMPSTPAQAAQPAQPAQPAPSAASVTPGTQNPRLWGMVICTC
jgi:nucleoprotein TPR